MRKFIVVFAIISGGLAAMFGPLAGLAIGAVAWLGRSGAQATVLPTVTIALTLTCLGLGFGLALAWAGWQALRGAPGGSLALPHWGWLALGILAVLVLGQVTFTAGYTPLVPILHITAGVLPPLLFLSLVVGAARRWGGATSTRAAVSSLAWGGLGGAGIALLLELVIGLIGLGVLLVWLVATNPDAISRLENWALQARATGQPGDLSELKPLLTTLPVTLSLLGLIGVLAPLVEEGVKALAVPLVALTGRKLTRLDGFVFGTAAGAGFAIFEGILNGTLALATPNGWAGLMLLRGGTAAIHCLAAGLVGLGWQAALTERRWLRGAALGLAGAIFHGAWNTAASLQTLTALGMASGAGQATGVALGIALLAFMVVLWLAATMALAMIPRYLAPVQPLSPLTLRPETADA